MTNTIRVMQPARLASVDLWHACGYKFDMAKTTTIRARIEPRLKAEAEAVLAKLGLTPSDAIRLLYHQVKLSRSLPFEIAIERKPNAVTRRAMKDLETGRGIRKYASHKELADDLGL